ncbi:hypothetical protein FBU30_001435 [Linnemannia zychae]|nr:hypothetical protein FBU30_001435 [Linnemannia zychae]
MHIKCCQYANKAKFKYRVSSIFDSRSALKVYLDIDNGAQKWQNSESSGSISYDECKEQHKKEIKKNKQDRKKVRELGSVLRDTTTETELAEHEELEKQGKLDKDGLKKLAELREKMAKIIEVKKAHGIKIKPKKVEAPKPVPVAEPVRDPTRSIYYDPVLNPYGAPPPGQPYLEYPPLPTEFPLGHTTASGIDQQKKTEDGIESDSEGSDSSLDSDSDSDSDSSSESSSEDEDDDNYMPPLPEGPPPTKEDQAKYLEPTKAKILFEPRVQHLHQRPPMQGMHPSGMFPPGMYPPDMRGPPGQSINPYVNDTHPKDYPLFTGPPTNFQPPFGNMYSSGRPGPLPGFGPPGFGPSAGFHGPESSGVYGPPGYHQGPPHFGPSHTSRPPRPHPQRPPSRYVKPSRASDAQSDPMTGHLPPDEKEKKHQGEAKETSVPAAPHPLPPKPTITQVPAKPTAVAGPASISAEPQLRNLQKELIHLVPSAIMRKRVTQKGKIGKPVNAAPGIEEDSTPVSSPSASNTNSSSLTAASLTSLSSHTSNANENEEEQRETALGLRLPKINLAPSVPSFMSSTRMVINSAPEVPIAPIDKAAKKRAEYDEFMQGLEGDGLL